MKVIRYPERAEWSVLLERPHADLTALQSAVNEILSCVKARGDEAVAVYTKKFDGQLPPSFEVSRDEINDALTEADPAFVDAMLNAVANITEFHNRQKQQSFIDAKPNGVLMGQRIRGLKRVGLYVPGAGTAVIGLGGDCRADDYDTVVLTDALTGRTVDLKEEDYGFYASEAGDVNGRFSIQFNKRLNTRGGVWAYAEDNGGIVVRGLIKGQMVRTYMAGGQMVDSRIAAGETETVSGLEKGMYLIQVVSDGREPTVIKIRLQ